MYFDDNIVVYFSFTWHLFGIVFTVITKSSNSHESFQKISLHSRVLLRFRLPLIREKKRTAFVITI